MLIFLVCLLMGLLWGWLFTTGMTLAGFPMDGTDAVLSGLLFGMLMFPCLVVMGRMQNKRVQAAAQKLPSPASHIFVTLLLDGKHAQARAACLCADCLCLADITSKSLPITIYPAEEIIRAAQPSRGILEVHLTEGRTLTFRANNSEAMLAALRERGWLPFQH